MNSTTIAPPAPAISLDSLHGSVPVEPHLLPPPGRGNRPVYGGRFEQRRPQQGHFQPHRGQQGQQAPQLSEVQAKSQLVAALAASLAYFKTLPEDEAKAAEAALVKGTCPTGFVKTIRDGKRVDTAAGLQSLIYAVNHLNTTKTFGRGNSLLFFFSVPKGWSAYAGTVMFDRMSKHYAKLDRKLKRAWEAKLDAGYVLPPDTRPEYYEEVDAFSNQAFGPLERKFIETTRVKSKRSKLPPGPGEDGAPRKLPRLVNDYVPMHLARTITFVIDKSTGRLTAWQPGRYIADMTEEQLWDRVTLTSGDTIDEDL